MLAGKPVNLRLGKHNHDQILTWHKKSRRDNITEYTDTSRPRYTLQTVMGPFTGEQGSQIQPVTHTKEIPGVLSHLSICRVSPSADFQ